MAYYYVRQGHGEQTQLNMFDNALRHSKGDTYTIETWRVPTRWDQCAQLKRQLTSFNKRYKKMRNAERTTLYRHYNIPKRSGGLRPIDDPCDQLRTALTELREMLDAHMAANHHTAAFAYVEGRSTINAVQRLMSTNANYIAHFDFHNFFGGITPDFVYHQFERVYPFGLWCRYDSDFKHELQLALSLAFLNNGLPQGTNISPWLSNIVMIPFDQFMARWARTKDIQYIRYADDIYLSCYHPIDMAEAKRMIEGCLVGERHTFVLNDEKTKQLRIGGPVYVLGVSIGADKKITVGTERKKFMKVCLNNFCAAVAAGNSYTQEDAMELNGQLSYCSEVEPEYFAELINKYERKYHINYKDAMRRFIRGY